MIKHIKPVADRGGPQVNSNSVMPKFFDCRERHWKSTCAGPGGLPLLGGPSFDWRHDFTNTGPVPPAPVKTSQKKDGCHVGPQVSRVIAPPRKNLWIRY